MKREGIHLEIWFPFGSITRLKRGGWSASGALQEIFSSWQGVSVELMWVRDLNKVLLLQIFRRSPQLGILKVITKTGPLQSVDLQGAGSISINLLEDSAYMMLCSSEVQRRKCMILVWWLIFNFIHMQRYSICIFNNMPTVYAYPGIWIECTCVIKRDCFAYIKRSSFKQIETWVFIPSCCVLELIKGQPDIRSSFTSREQHCGSKVLALPGLIL